MARPKKEKELKHTHRIYLRLTDTEYEIVSTNAKNEIKSRHYILSFDPKDTTENDLTGEQAQRLGLEYAQKNFPGHQALIYTHMDGNNESGNIHVHIVINSLRKYDIEKQTFMTQRSKFCAGCKHHERSSPHSD